MVKAKPGRKRKDGNRYPCGQLVREDMGLVAEYARLKEQARRGAADARWENELGRLHYMGKIVDTQRTAGEEWAELVRQHKSIAIDAPKGHAKTSNMEPRIPGSTIKEYPLEVVRRIEDRYDRTFSGIIDMGRDGIAVMRATNRLCCDNEPLPYQDLILAKKGLDRLSVLFGLMSISTIRRRPVG